VLAEKTIRHSMSYNLIDNYPLFKAAAIAIVAVGTGIWLFAEGRALRGASRIRRDKAHFEPCTAIDVKTFLGPVKSVSVMMTDGTKLTFRPMDKQQALGLLGIRANSFLSIARDPEGGPTALLKTNETEVIGFARKFSG